MIFEIHTRLYKQVFPALAFLCLAGFADGVQADPPTSECRNVNGAKACGPTSIVLQRASGGNVIEDGFKTGSEQALGRDTSAEDSSGLSPSDDWKLKNGLKTGSLP